MSAAELVTTTIGSKTFRCTARTEAHLLWTVERLAVDFPATSLVIIQGCYNTGVQASAGTHDYDAVLDLRIVGLSWRDAERWLREHGWAAWYRYPPTFSDHIHMVSLGYSGRVGQFVPGQVADYYAHRSGLAGHAADNTWHPADIDSTIFDYDAWTEENEMNPAQEQRLERVEQAVDRLEDAVALVLAVVRKKGANAWERDVDLKALVKEVLAEAKKP